MPMPTIAAGSRFRHKRATGLRHLFIFATFKDTIRPFCRSCWRRRWVLVPVYLVVAGLVLWLVGSVRSAGRSRRRSMPGQFQLRIRAPSGPRLEVTEEITRKTLEVIKEVAGPRNVDMSVAYVG